MDKERIKGIVEIDKILRHLKRDPEYYHVSYEKLVKSIEVVGLLKDSANALWDHEFIYKEQDNLGDKFRGFIFIPIGHDYYAKFKYII